MKAAIERSLVLHRRTRATPFSYVMAVLAVAVAALTRWLLDAWLHDTVPFATFFLAVVFSGWYGGWRAALLATVLGFFLSWWMFVGSRFTFELHHSSELAALLVYLTVALAISGLSGAMVAAIERATKIATGALEQAELLRITLASIGDAVIAVDLDSRVTSLNSVAEQLTGWDNGSAIGVSLDTVFRIVNEATRKNVENPVHRALREGGVVGLANHTILIAKDGTEWPIDDSASPIRNREGQIVGCVLVFRDVSERKQNEIALRAAEQLPRNILESISDAFLALDQNWRFSYVNPQAERIFECRAADLLGKSIWEVYDIAETEFGRAYRRVVREQVTQTFTAYFAERSAWYEVHAYPASEGISVYFRDATQRIAAEARERQLLQESAAADAKFRAFFDQGTLFAGIVDLDGTILDPNRICWEACGYTRDQVVGVKFWNGPWWTPSATLVTQIKAAFEQARDGATFRAELPYYVSGGIQRTVELTIVPVKSDAGDVLFVAPTGIDITERKKAEAQLLRSEERYRTLFDSMDQGFCVVDVIFEQNGAPCDYRFIEVNPAFEKHTGLKDVVGKTIRELVPNIESHWFEIYGRVALTGERTHFTNTASEMGGRWFDVYAFRIGGEESRKVAIFFKDVTEMRHNEQSLKEADRRKDEFLAILAHELRNPLAPIRNALQIVQRSQDGTAIKNAAVMMERQVNHMVRLVDDLLDVSRITRGKIDLRRDRVALSQVLLNAVETCRPLIDGLGHELTISLPDYELYLNADTVRLTQAFANLVNNACKYTEPKGRIQILVQRQDQDAMVSIKDSGAGIAPDMLASIFEMFIQVDHTLERSQGGLGIGLTLVRSLIQLHGGSVSAQSDGLGRGSEFIVRLPVLMDDPIGVPMPNETVNPSPVTGRRILVVDDNRDSAATLSLLLKMTGNEVQVAYDGMEALESAESFHPDVVLLDIGLPLMNGFDVARTIRGNAWGQSMVLVALTGWGQDEDRRKSLEAGFDAHMVKPVDYTALTTFLAELKPRVPQ